MFVNDDVGFLCALQASSRAATLNQADGVAKEPEESENMDVAKDRGRRIATGRRRDGGSYLVSGRLRDDCSIDDLLRQERAKDVNFFQKLERIDIYKKYGAY